MPNKHYLTWSDIHVKIDKMRKEIVEKHYKNGAVKIYGIPRGGSIVAGFLSWGFYYLEVVNDPKKADVFVDDIFDSGKTYNDYTQRYKKPFYVLVNKSFNDEFKLDTWVVFPWENEKKDEKDLKDSVIRIWEYCNRDIQKLTTFITQTLSINSMISFVEKQIRETFDEAPISIPHSDSNYHYTKIEYKLPNKIRSKSKRKK